MTKPIIVDRTQPNSYITALMKYKKSGKLLDMGTGHGRHAIYFAQQGFDVTATDPDPSHCKEIKQKADQANLQIKIAETDIEGFNSNNPFNVIVCAMVLHFLDQDKLIKAVSKMQSLTEVDGLNVISAYTNQNTGDFMKGNPYGSEKYLLIPNELREMYKDWDILEYSEDWTEPGIIKSGDIPMSYHKVNMIARKL